MNKPFKKGQEVYSVEFGHGVVQAAVLKAVYGIKVRFCTDRSEIYTHTGKRVNSSSFAQTLFHADVGVIKFYTTPKLDVDQLVWVRDSRLPVTWFPRHFAEFKDGRVFCFPDGRSSLTTSDTWVRVPWGHYSLTDPHKRNAS